jgi:hypothetical protein
MKKVLTIMAVVFILLPFQQVGAQGNDEHTARDIIKAYKTKNADLLKKYATAMLLPSISESFFEDKKIQPLVEQAQKWDGKIRGIRHSSMNFMGKKISNATVYFSDGDKPGEINVVVLTSMNKSPWKAFAMGITTIEKKEFDEMGKSKKAAKSSEDTPGKNFSIEMANGDKIKSPSINKLEKGIKSLNDDNFYLILSHKDDYIQAAYSAKGHSVEYQDKTGHYEASKLLSQEEVIALFTVYLTKDANWKNGFKWDKN